MPVLTSRGKVTVDPDLARERQNCTFDPNEITNILDGSQEKTKERQDLGKIVFLGNWWNAIAQDWIGT